MKFGKLLAETVDAMPWEYRDRFLNYKLLKKHISLYKKTACQCSVELELEEGLIELRRPHISSLRRCEMCGHFLYDGIHDHQQQQQLELTSYDHPHHPRNAPTAPAKYLKFQVFMFQLLLKKELSKINTFFNCTHQQYTNTMNDLNTTRREEEARQAALHPNGRDFWIETELLEIRRSVIDLAAKMVLLKNYCLLNYTAFLKILKKHDRVTGSHMRLEFSEQTLEKSDFFVHVPDINEDVFYCVSMLDHFPQPRSSRRGRGSQAPCKAASSCTTEFAAATDPAPVTIRAPRVRRDPSTWILQLQTLLIVSRNGEFNYIRAAQEALVANLMVSKGGSSTLNSESVSVSHSLAGNLDP